MFNCFNFKIECQPLKYQCIPTSLKSISLCNWSLATEIFVASDWFQESRLLEIMVAKTVLLNTIYLTLALERLTSIYVDICLRRCPEQNFSIQFTALLLNTVRIIRTPDKISKLD